MRQDTDTDNSEGPPWDVKPVDLLENPLIEIRNETDEDISVRVCESTLSGQIYVHICEAGDDAHGEETVVVPAEYFKQVEVNEVDV